MMVFIQRQAANLQKLATGQPVKSVQESTDPGQDSTDTDSYALRVKKVVSVTPLSLDMTSRVDLEA
ncbi:MAG: hypothetical protein ACU83V_14360 [Gammaproteobacteria bacterium]